MASGPCADAGGILYDVDVAAKRKFSRMTMPPEFATWLDTPDGALLREDIIAWAKWRRIKADPVTAFDLLIGGGLREFRSLVIIACQEASQAVPSSSS